MTPSIALGIVLAFLVSLIPVYMQEVVCNNLAESMGIDSIVFEKMCPSFPDRRTPNETEKPEEGTKLALST